MSHLPAQSIRRCTAGFLESSCPLDRVRQIADAEQTIAQDVHDGLVGLGIPGILIPEDFGGVGLGFLEAALVAESLGYTVAPVPFSASSIMAPVALLSAGSDAQQEHWLPKIASGEVTIAVGIKEQIGRRETNGVAASGTTLTGRAMFVLEGMEADAYLIADSAGLLYRVAADANGLSRTKLKTIDRTRSVAEIALNNTPADVLPGSASSNEALLATIDAGRVMLAADTAKQP